MKRGAIVIMVIGFVLLLVFACAGGDDWAPPDNSPDSGSYWECFGANDCQPGQYCNEFHRCIWASTPDGDGDIDADGDADGDTEPYVPPEVEYDFGPPASGFRYVYIALTDLDSVARVDSETLDVVSIPVGDRPMQLSTVNGQDLAVVLNRGSNSISIIRTEEGEDEVTTLRTPPRMNRLVVSPGGGAALAYFEMDNPQDTDVGSFQDMAVVRLQEGREESVQISVGFRPRRIFFSTDDSQAYVVTEDGVSIVDLEGAEDGFTAPTFRLTNDPFGEGIPTEVVVSPDGSWAFARWEGQPFIRALDLDSGDLIDTPLPGSPTDIDLTSDGSRLLMVVRDVSLLALMEVPGSIGDESALRLIDCAPLTVGSAVITPDDQQVLVFTNALNQEAIALVDLEGGEVEIAMLRKGIRAVALSPDGLSALVMHNRIPGDPEPTDDFETQLDRRSGFSLIDLESLFIKLQLTESDPGRFTFFPDSSAAYVIVADRSANLREINRIDLESFVVEALDVGSFPIEVGPVPGTHRIYVSQDHPMGRLSFIDVESGEMRTVTGFELNSQIIE
jgi:DNA-binding beta-propeller fold protein YncE